MAGAPYDGGGIAHDGRRHPGRRRRASCARGWRRLVAEMRAAGHHDARGQVRLRPDGRRRGARRCGWPRGHRRDDVPRRARRPGRVRRRRGDYVDLVTGPMLAACAPHARWVDVFCEPARRFDADEARAVLRGRRGRRARAAGARQPARRRARRAARRRARRRQRRPLHPPDAADVDALRRRRHDRRHAAARRRVLDPLAVPRRPAPARRRRRPSRWPPTATRARCYTSSMPVRASRSPSARCGMTPAEALCVGDRRRGARRCAARTSGGCAPGARADLAVLDAPSYRAPGLPARRTARAHGRSSWAGRSREADPSGRRQVTPRSRSGGS